MTKRESRKRKAEPEESYSSEGYWDARYKTGDIDHEWYYSYEILEPLLQSALADKDLAGCRALEIGCGDRPLISKFHKLGFKAEHLLGMDFSAVVIDLLQSGKTLKEDEVKAQYSKGDARKMPQYESSSFELVVDKGTMDAMLSSSSRSVGLRNARQCISEAVRVLSSTGSFVLVSHIEVDSDEFEVLVNDILLPALESKSMVNFTVRAHIVTARADKDSSSGQYGTTYIITSHPKRETRRSANSKPTVSFEVLQYTDSDNEEEEGEEEGDDAMYCIPCS